MKNMEEIEYWVQTKRAPCLYTYDKLRKSQNIDNNSKLKLVDLSSPVKEPPINISPKKKKKRKLSILDESCSERCEENVFFHSAPHPQHNDTVLSSCKDSIISKTDLNIKKNLNTKRPKVQKVNNGKEAQKHKIVSSTPKPVVTTKRKPRNLENTRLLESSLESGLFSGGTKNKQSSLSKSVSKKSETLLKKDKLANGDQTQDVYHVKIVNKHKPDVAQNGEFDDISDVSGFTANYIRSTKKNSQCKKLSQTKNIKKQLVKESQESVEKKEDGDKMLLCVNKSVNTTGDPTQGINCSSDSYIFNLVTIETKPNEQKVVDCKPNKSTSVLKFLKPTSNNQSTDKIINPKKPAAKVSTKKVLDTSLQSTSTVSRYFTRSKVSSLDDSIFHIDITSTPKKSTSKKCRNHTKTIDSNKTNLEDKRTKGKRNKPTNSVLVIDNATEQVSTSVSMNVADYNKKLSKNSAVKRLIKNKSELSATVNTDKSASSAARERSGFANCFSESDDDRPLRKPEFFA